MADTKSAIAFHIEAFGSEVFESEPLVIVIDFYGKDPAQAATVWLAIGSVYDGLGGNS